MGDMLNNAKAITVDQGMALPLFILGLFPGSWFFLLLAAIMCKDEDKKKSGIILSLLCWALTFCFGIGWCVSVYVLWNIYQGSK